MSLKKLVDLDLLGRAVTKIKALIPNAASAAPGKVASSSSQGSSANYARQDHTHGIDLATGDSNGQVKIAGNNVSVKGLAALAYKASLGKSDVGLGNVDNVKQYSASNPPPYPVTSVNGSTGAVTVSVPSAGTATPKMDGTAAVGSSAKYAKEDHVHPVDTSRAPASHTHSAGNILGGYLNIHPENSPTLIPFMHNDIAHLLSRGGSAIVKYDNTQQSVDISAVFDGSGSYWAINPTGITTIIIELTLHKSFGYSNWIYADFGFSDWRAKSVSVDVINTNYADDVWTNKYQTTANTLGHVAFSTLHTPVGASNSGGGFNKVRFTFSVWARSTMFRISQLGIYNCVSCGLRETYMSRGVDDAVFRSITPNANVTYNLGSSSNKWNHIYAKYLNDTEIPASPKFTDTTALGSMTGTLGVDHGGTGKTNATDAANVFMNALGTGSSTPVDADYYISQYVGGGTTTTTYHRRPMSALWEYIKGKISSVLGLTASSYGGSAAKVNDHTVAVDVPSGAKFTDTTYESKAAASGGTDVSLVTTGEKATWNAKTSNVGTITGIKMNGVSKGTSGVVDLGTVITSHQSLSGKQDKLVSGTNIKTINGNSLLGSGNLAVSGLPTVTSSDNDKVLKVVNGAWAVTEGGGGSSLSYTDAILHAKAPLGSSLTFTKGSISERLGPEAAHPNADGIYGDWYYSIESSNFGAWSITAALNNRYDTTTVSPAEAKQYDILLRYTIHLFENGDQYVSTTGGWYALTGTTITDSLIKIPPDQAGNFLHRGSTTVNKVSFGGRTVLKAKFVPTYNYNGGSDYWFQLGLSLDKSRPHDYRQVYSLTSFTTTDVDNKNEIIASVDISDFKNSSLYVYFSLRRSGANVSEVWLEW